MFAHGVGQCTLTLLHWHLDSLLWHLLLREGPRAVPVQGGAFKFRGACNAVLSLSDEEAQVCAAVVVLVAM